MKSSLLLWDVSHAGLMLLTTALASSLRLFWLIPAAGAASFVALVILFGDRWTPQRTFGAANWLTVLRLSGVILLSYFAANSPAPYVAVIGLVLLLADGLDGWLARVRSQSSEFGEYFDKETDAFFILLLCAAIAFNGLLGFWILIPGLLRYAFSLALFFAPPHALKERRSWRGRLLFILLMIALLSCFLPIPKIYQPLSVLATVLLTYSFIEDAIWAFSKK